MLTSFAEMLCSCCASMSSEVFDKLPNSTNAVEAHNRLSKGSSPEVLQVALLSTYKVDMSATLQHIAKAKGVSITYDDMSPSARAKRADALCLARRKRRKIGDDEGGPPDKRRHFDENGEYILCAVIIGRILYTITSHAVNIFCLYLSCHYSKQQSSQKSHSSQAFDQDISAPKKAPHAP